MSIFQTTSEIVYFEIWTRFYHGFCHIKGGWII